MLPKSRNGVFSLLMTVERLLVTGPHLNTDPRSQTLPGKSPEMAFFAQEIVLSPWTSLLWLAMQQLLSIRGISIRSLKTLFLTASIFNTEVSQLRPHVCLVGSAIPDISLLRQLVPCTAVHAKPALVLFTYLSTQRSPIPPHPRPYPQEGCAHGEPGGGWELAGIRSHVRCIEVR